MLHIDLSENIFDLLSRKLISSDIDSTDRKKSFHHYVNDTVNSVFPKLFARILIVELILDFFSYFINLILAQIDRLMYFIFVSIISLYIILCFNYGCLGMG